MCCRVAVTLGPAVHCLDDVCHGAMDANLLYTPTLLGCEVHASIVAKTPRRLENKHDPGVMLVSKGPLNICNIQGPAQPQKLKHTVHARSPAYLTSPQHGHALGWKRWRGRFCLASLLGVALDEEEGADQIAQHVVSATCTEKEDLSTVASVCIRSSQALRWQRGPTAVRRCVPAGSHGRHACTSVRCTWGSARLLWLRAPRTLD